MSNEYCVFSCSFVLNPVISHLYEHVADFQQTSLSCSVQSRAPVLRVRLVRWIYALHCDTQTHKVLTLTSAQTHKELLGSATNRKCKRIYIKEFHV